MPNTITSYYFSPANAKSSKPSNKETTSSYQPKSTQSLREKWTELYTKTLPSAARDKSPAQPRWSVHLDHCFARIILDNAIGITTPWTEKLRSPANKHMSDDQFTTCIHVANEILEGKVNLVDLDEISLQLRGKTKGNKRKLDEVEHEFPSTEELYTGNELPKKKFKLMDDQDEADLKAIINSSEKSPFQKQVLLLLLQIPPGKLSSFTLLP